MQHGDKSRVKWCPVCDEGWVHAVRMPKWNMSAYLCEECEALWMRDEMIDEHHFWQLSDYVGGMLRAGVAPVIERIIVHDDSEVEYLPW